MYHRSLNLVVKAPPLRMAASGGTETDPKRAAEISESLDVVQGKLFTSHLRQSRPNCARSAKIFGKANA